MWSGGEGGSEGGRKVEEIGGDGKRREGSCSLVSVIIVTRMLLVAASEGDGR